MSTEKTSNSNDRRQKSTAEAKPVQPPESKAAKAELTDEQLNAIAGGAGAPLPVDPPVLNGAGQD